MTGKLPTLTGHIFRERHELKQPLNNEEEARFEQIMFALKNMSKVGHVNLPALVNYQDRKLISKFAREEQELNKNGYNFYGYCFKDNMSNKEKRFLIEVFKKVKYTFEFHSKISYVVLDHCVNDKELLFFLEKKCLVGIDKVIVYTLETKTCTEIPVKNVETIGLTALNLS